jgi:DNA-directed RNA polymerase sigma subunit (sigma70/sigma32)
LFREMMAMRCDLCEKHVPNAEQRAEIRKLADGLRTVQEIAAATGATYNAVYQQMHREGLAAQRDDRRQRGWERYLFAANERTNGKTLEQIGTALGVSRERARQMIKEVERINQKITNGATK